MGFLRTSTTIASATGDLKISQVRRCSQCRRAWRGERAITKHFYDTVRTYCCDCHKAHEAMRNDLEGHYGAPVLNVPKTVRQHYSAALRLGYAQGLLGTELGHWMAADWRRDGPRGSRGSRTTAR